MTVLLTRVPPGGRMQACFVFPMNAIEMPLTYRFLPNSSTNLRSWCPQIAATATRKLPGFRAQLYGLGYPRQPSPRATLAEVTFSLFLSKIQPAVYIRIANSSRGARQLGWASCLTSAARVTLASGTTFLHINALARLTGTILGVANVT